MTFLNQEETTPEAPEIPEAPEEPTGTPESAK